LYRVTKINHTTGTITLELENEVAWQDDFLEKIVHGGVCPVCAGEIVRADYNGYTWRCDVRPSDRFGYPRFGVRTYHHTSLDFIRVMYPKKRTYEHGDAAWIQPESAGIGAWIPAEPRSWSGWAHTEGKIIKYRNQGGGWEEVKEEKVTENEFGPVMP
jgi:hypothetical protein